MKAIMLAAGSGVRCRPFTYLMPKMMLQVGGIPLLEYMMSWFYGEPLVDHLYIAVSDDNTANALRRYLAERQEYAGAIEGAFARLGYHIVNANPGLQVDVVRVLGWGTGGDLMLAMRQIEVNTCFGEDLLVCNADYVISRSLSDGTATPQANLAEMIDGHRQAREQWGTAMTVALHSVRASEAVRFGVAMIDRIPHPVVRTQPILGFTEKPSIESMQISKPDANVLINAGIYILDTFMLDGTMESRLTWGVGTSLERRLLEPLSHERLLAGHIMEMDAWFDVGTLEGLIHVNRWVCGVCGVDRVC